MHPPRRRPAWLVAVGLLVAVVVLAVVLYLPVYATSASNYCGSCHDMSEAYETWSHSAHSEVECVECHVPPGRSAALKWRARETRNIWASYLNMKPVDERESRPMNENCVRCHPLDGLMGIPGKLRMPHDRHINQNNLMCIDCHDNTSHAAEGESSEVSMSPCTMCHEQTSDPARCSFCHYTDPGEETHPSDFITAHGKLAATEEKDCLRCHHDKEQFCDGCHAKPPPGHYQGEWRYDHGKEAAKDRSLCLGCHSYEALCKQCHEVSHPNDWAANHAAVGAKGTESCMVCHPPLMCGECHGKEGVPPL